jgi:sulfur-carrier protein
MIHVLYFARLREQLGTGSETLPAPEGTASVADIVTMLRGRDGPWAEAFAPDQTLLAAVNQELARGDTLVADGDELAFFPPVTGG